MAFSDRNGSNEALHLTLHQRANQSSTSRCGRWWPVVAALARGFCAFQVQWWNRRRYERNDSPDFTQKWQETAPNWPVPGSLSLSGTLVPLAALPGRAATSE
jgi:hypothetical protein